MNQREIEKLEKVVEKIKKESVVETAVKELKEEVDKNASSKFMLEHMMNFIETISSKK